MRKYFWIPLLAAIAAYVLLPMPGQGQNISQKIGAKRAQIAKKQRKEEIISGAIKAYNGRISGLQGGINRTQRRLSVAQAELDDKRAELLKVRAKLESARDRLARARAELRVARRSLSERLVELYKADQPDALTVILQSDGFNDLLERTEYLERISEHDGEIVDKVRVLKAKFEKQEAVYADLEQTRQRAAEVVLARRDEIASSRDRLANQQGELRLARNERRHVLADTRRSRVALEGDLRQLEAAQARVTGQLQSLPASAGPVKQGSGSLIWPVNGPVVSPFGMRWGRLHAGVDIAVPTGTPIRASDSGRVVIAGWVGGYGNYTCVQHTASMSTCNGHQSRIGVSVGQNVSKGQIIGNVGCTGHCFGPHSHFEVRINGSPVDPMGYL